MKKFVGLIVAVLVIIAGGISYYTINQYAQKKVEQNIHTFLKKAHLENDVHYKSLETHLLSKGVDINDVNWTVKQQGVATGKISIKRLRIFHFSKGSIDGSFEHAVFINLDKQLPNNLFNKPFAEVEKGLFSYSKNGGLTKTTFEANNIRLDKSLLKASNPSPSDKEILKLFKLDSPISLLISASMNENKNTFNINSYTINWQDNIKLSYSMYISNVDIKGFKNITKSLQTKADDPLVILLDYLSKLYEMKPQHVKLSISDLGLVKRIINYVASKGNVTKQSLLEQVNSELSSTELSRFKQPILNLLSGKSPNLVLELENKNNLSVGDILQALQTQQLGDVVLVRISN